MKRAKQILALLLALALLPALGGVAEEPVEAAEMIAAEEAEAPEAGAAAEPAVAEESDTEGDAEIAAEPQPEAAEEAEEAVEAKAAPVEAAPSGEIRAESFAAEGDEEEAPLIIYPSKLTMCIGEKSTQKISAAADKSFTYSSSNAKVVSINSKGKLTAKKAGSATITVTGKTTKRSVKCKVTVKAAPLEVRLNKYKGKLDIDDEYQLTSSISPGSAPQGVSWRSSNTKVATVEDGLVTALSEGSATITATANKKSEGGVTVAASYKLTVVDPAKPATLTIEGKAKRTLTLDGDLSFEATMTPETAESEIEWKTSNKKIATVEDGEVTPVSEGTVTITAITKSKGQSGKKLSAKVTVTVTDPAKPAGISIVGKSSKPMICYIGDDPLALEYTLKPSTKTEAESDVTFKSSNTKVAKVSEEGEVEAKKAGTVVITVTTKKKGPKGKRLSDSVKIVVIDPTKPMLIELDQKGTVEVPKGDTLQLEATITPDTASDAKLTWSSSNKKVATVSQEGEVTAKKKGTAKITVKSKNGKKASVTIRVVPAEE